MLNVGLGGVADPLGATSFGKDLEGGGGRCFGSFELEPVGRIEQGVPMPRLPRHDGSEEGPLSQALGQERVADRGPRHRLGPGLVNRLRVEFIGSAVKVPQDRRLAHVLVRVGEDFADDVGLVGIGDVLQHPQVRPEAKVLGRLFLW